MSNAPRWLIFQNSVTYTVLTGLTDLVDDEVLLYTLVSVFHRQGTIQGGSLLLHDMAAPNQFSVSCPGRANFCILADSI